MTADRQALDLDRSEAIPPAAIEKVVDLMRSGRLYRYSGGASSEVSLMEAEFAQLVGTRFALAVNSCGAALYLALLCAGVGRGMRVLSNAFTYTAVPSAIVRTGAEPVFVETTDRFYLDCNDLEAKASAGADCLLISHMRSHLCDMERVVEICKHYDLPLIEDCAHSLGATFNGKPTGTFGLAGCFSTQSYKLVNCGEGGVITTDDESLIVKAVLYSGTQDDQWRKHVAAAGDFAALQSLIPNYSCRMSEIAAAIVRPQLGLVDKRLTHFRSSYEYLSSMLKASSLLVIPEEDPRVVRCSDTVQFSSLFKDEATITRFLTILRSAGVAIKHFGAKGNPRFFRSWEYIDGIREVDLPATEALLMRSYDIRLPNDVNESELELLASLVRSAAEQAVKETRETA